MAPLICAPVSAYVHISLLRTIALQLVSLRIGRLANTQAAPNATCS